MFEQAFKRIDDILWLMVSNELDYVEQSSWLLFLKYLNDLEKERELQAMLGNKHYQPIITGDFCWDKWAAPTDGEGNQDKRNALTGDDLIEFVNLKLFPYLRKFRESAAAPDTLEYKIGEMFGELKNKITDGESLRDILWIIDDLRFQTSEEKPAM